MKHIVRIMLKSIAIILFIVFLIGMLLYAPFVQHWGIRKISDILDTKGMKLECEDVYLRFPFSLEAQKIWFSMNQKDTTLYLSDLDMDVSLKSLFDKRIVLNNLDINQTRVVFKNDDQLDLNIRLQRILLRNVSWLINSRDVETDQLSLSNSDINMMIRPQESSSDTTQTRFDWNFKIDECVLENIVYHMNIVNSLNLRAEISSGKIDNASIRIDEQRVTADSLQLLYSGCELDQLSQSPTNKASSVKESTKDTLRQNWRIELGYLQLVDSYYRMNETNKTVFPLNFYDISVEMDSIVNQGLEIRSYIRSFSAKQQSGLEIRKLSGYVNFFEDQIDIDSLVIETLNSLLHVDLYSSGNITGVVNKDLLYLDLTGFVGLADLTPFYPHLNKELITKDIQINSHIAIDKKEIQLHKMDLVMKDNFEFSGSGHLSDFTQPKLMSGKVEWEGLVFNNDVLNTLLNNKFYLPGQLHLSSIITLDKGDGNVSFYVNSSEGNFKADAKYVSLDSSYSVSLSTDSLNIGKILISDRFGFVSCDLSFQGHNFKFPGIEGKIDCQLNQFEYNSYNYSDIHLEGWIEDDRIRLAMESNSAGLDLSLRSQINIVSGNYNLFNQIDVRKLNLSLLNFAQTDNDFSFTLNLDGNIAKEYQNFNLYIDSLQVTTTEGIVQGYRSIALEGSSGKNGTHISGNSGDMDLMLGSIHPLDTVINQFKTIIRLASSQYHQEIFNVDTLINQLPDLSVDLRGGPLNGINGILSHIGMGFTKISFALNTNNSEIQLKSQIINWIYQGVIVDTIALNMSRQDNRLDYAMWFVKRQSTPKDQLRVAVYGNVEGDQVVLRLKQGSQNRVNLNLGLKIHLYSQSLVVNIESDNLVLIGETWQVNPDNYFILTKDKIIKTNLRLSFQDKLAHVYSTNSEQADQNILHLVFKKLYLQNLATAFPFLPDLGGVLNSDITLYSSKLHTGINGNVKIDSFSYNQFDIGDLDTRMIYNVETVTAQRKVNFTIHLDSIPRAVVDGVFTASDKNNIVDIRVDVNALPLRTINAFIPNELLRLSGMLNGQIHVSNTLNMPKVNGHLSITDGNADVTIVGTNFTIDNVEIPIINNKIGFNNFKFYASNKSFLNLNGNLTIHDLTNLTTDLKCTATNFQVVNVSKNDSTLLFGKAYADINATLRGDISALRLIGNVSILSSSQLNYVVTSSSPTTIQNKAEGLIKFIVFADTLQENYLPRPVQYSGNNFNMKLFINIAPEVLFAVQLPGNVNNSISIVGGGNLIFAMTDTEGMTLYGKYIINNGTVNYSIPVVGTKLFTILSGSYVEWLGNAMDPRLSITASEQVKANVQLEGQSSRLVVFDAIIKIENSLQRPQIRFDLSSPNDMTIQSQLATFSPEERSKQAMNLLVYGTYSGPGAVKSSNVGPNSALYNFVEGELNQWSKRLVKNADLSFGVDTYDQYSASGQGTVRTDYSYQFSKQFFNDRILIKVGGSISTDSDPQQKVQENLIDDIDVEYRLRKNQNLFLKVFRHTNFISVLEGDITETGVGILWRKQFRSWRDLFLKAIKKAQ